MPGNALKLEEAQKKVSFHSRTKMQLGSGWKPGSMGFTKVLLAASAAVFVAARVVPARASAARAPSTNVVTSRLSIAINGNLMATQGQRMMGSHSRLNDSKKGT